MKTKFVLSARTVSSYSKAPRAVFDSREEADEFARVVLGIDTHCEDDACISEVAYMPSDKPVMRGGGM